MPWLSSQGASWRSAAAPTRRADLAAAARQDERRDALHAQAPRERRGLVDVDAHELEPARVLACERLERRCDDPARAAPGR
jgi:hypothetical protein